MISVSLTQEWNVCRRLHGKSSGGYRLKQYYSDNMKYMTVAQLQGYNERQSEIDSSSYKTAGGK